MYTQSLLTAALLAATSVAANQIDQALSTVASQAESIALQNTVAANAVYSWQATQTAVSNNDIQAQNADYFNAFITATATALPAYVTALPTSLLPFVSSLLVGEASLVATEVAPLVSSNAASASASGYIMSGSGTGSVNINSANSTSTSNVVATIGTSGMPRNSANATGSPTTPPNPSSPNPSSPKSSSGAGRNGVLVAAATIGVGLAGFMSLL